MSKEFDSVNRRIEIKGFPKLIKKQIGRMVQNDRIEEAEQIRRDYVKRKLDKGFDLINLRIEVKGPAKSVKKYIRRVVEKGNIEDIEEAKQIWGDYVNRKNDIKKRKESFFHSVDESIGTFKIPEERQGLEEIKNLTPEVAKKRISDFEGIGPDEREENFDLEEYIKRRWQEIADQPSRSSQWRYKQYGLYKYLHLLNSVYPEEIDFLFSVDGKGKTVFVKLRDAVTRARR